MFVIVRLMAVGIISISASVPGTDGDAGRAHDASSVFVIVS
ncbi:hypothetical protein AH4AK4_1074 [Aeromonas hydrophila 4AK4]|nr:hypothetical protein AH4AK4_1074 [Aeromonas hydrophila 4AK4]